MCHDTRYHNADWLDDLTEQLSELRQMDLCLQITLGMGYLHAKQVAHRDLKSSNVLICPENDGTLVYSCSMCISMCVHVHVGVCARRAREYFRERGKERERERESARETEAEREKEINMCESVCKVYTVCVR